MERWRYPFRNAPQVKLRLDELLLELQPELRGRQCSSRLPCLVGRIREYRNG